MSALTQYPNIQFRSVNIYKYAENTPAKDWIERNDQIFLSKYVIEHVSDYLRLLTLYKFGGIYFDLDTIIQRNLDDMPLNFAGAKDNRVIGNAIMGFDSTGAGHQIVEMLVRFVFEPFLIYYSYFREFEKFSMFEKFSTKKTLIFWFFLEKTPKTIN